MLRPDSLSAFTYPDIVESSIATVLFHILHTRSSCLSVSCLAASLFLHLIAKYVLFHNLLSLPSFRLTVGTQSNYYLG